MTTTPTTGAAELPKQSIREQIAAEVATQPAAQVEFLARWLCARDRINPDRVLDDEPVKLAWHREDLTAARLLKELAALAGQGTRIGEGESFKTHIGRNPMTDTTNTAAAGQKMPRKPTGKLAFAYATIMQLEAQVAEMRAAIGAEGVSEPLMNGYSAGDMASQGAEQFRAGQASMQAWAGEPVGWRATIPTTKGATHILTGDEGQVSLFKQWGFDVVPIYTQPAAHAGERYRLLNRGFDVIQADDEFLSEDTTAWGPDPNGIFEGMPYEGYALLPARRKLDVVIAAQQEGKP